VATPQTRTFPLKEQDARNLFFFSINENKILGPTRCRVQQVLLTLGYGHGELFEIKGVLELGGAWYSYNSHRSSAHRQTIEGH